MCEELNFQFTNARVDGSFTNATFEKARTTIATNDTVMFTRTSVATNATRRHKSFGLTLYCRRSNATADQSHLNWITIKSYLTSNCNHVRSFIATQGLTVRQKGSKKNHNLVTYYIIPYHYLSINRSHIIRSLFTAQHYGREQQIKMYDNRLIGQWKWTHVQKYLRLMGK